jgi:hypothetical protein
VAARSKAWVCGRRLAGIAGLNPAEGKSVLCECCALLGTCLCEGVHHSSGGVLPNVVCLSVIVNLHQLEALSPEGCRVTIKKLNCDFLECESV